MQFELSFRCYTQGNTAAEWRLHYGGNGKPIAIVIPDPMWPGMYRIWANGWLSDYANLSRVKDAAEVIAERGPPARIGNASVGSGRRRARRPTGTFSRKK